MTTSFKGKVLEQMLAIGASAAFSLCPDLSIQLTYYTEDRALSAYLLLREHFLHTVFLRHFTSELIYELGSVGRGLHMKSSVLSYMYKVVP